MEDFVNITVTRNENLPGFDKSFYNVTINETTQIGVNILRLNATDRDGVSIVLPIYMGLFFFPHTIIICTL